MRTHIISDVFNPFDAGNLPKKYINSCRKVWGETQKNNVPPIFTLKHLSLYTGIEYKYLYLICHREHNPYYNRTIRTSSKLRTLNIPHKRLSIIQNWINRNILREIKPSSSSKAYERGDSILKNAESHIFSENQWLIKLDIKDYFPSIRENEIYKIFHSLGYTKLLSLEMARLCTYSKNVYIENETNYPYIKSNGHLPQGSCTSPKLSNIYFKPIDIEIENKVKPKLITYTRYADDLTFSGDLKSYENCKLFIEEITSIIKNHGLVINKKKTRIISSNGIKKITGLTIKGGELYPTNKILNYIKTSLYYINKYDLESHIKYSKTPVVDSSVYKQHLMGKIFYVRNINHELGDKLLFEALSLGLNE